MNERIRKLAEQAKIDYELLPEIAREPVWIALDDELEKFAELIVRECMSNLYLHGYDDAAKCLQDIHFGIEDPV